MGISPAAIAALAISAVGTGVSIHQKGIADDRAKKADAVRQAQDDLANQRAIRQSIATAKVQRAQLVASGAAQTGSFGGATSVTGALGSAQTQIASNVGFARQTIGAGNAINTLNSQANRALSRAGTAQAFGALPEQFGFDPAAATRGLFSTPKKPETTETAKATA
jgi:hypothetical protein